jgi:glycerol-3-phosphate acyltransferase PlsX
MNTGATATRPTPVSQSARIAIDVMGGDYAPGVVINGALSALNTVPTLKLSLVGDRTIIEAYFRNHGINESASLKIVHSDEVISMDDHAAAVIRKKKNSSIHVGLKLLKTNDADAFISAGNSGAVMAGALVILGRLPDVERPAIAVKLPTAEGSVIVLDVGANVDCKASHLAQFAEMGRVYAEVIENIPRPRVGLLSNGSESHKGNELVRETNSILSGRKNLNYVGYVEGFDLFRGKADVVACDGFVGNVILKCAEGFAETCVEWLRKQIRRDVKSLVGMVLLKSTFGKFKNKFDYQPYGAAPLLGIDGMVLISHGSSTEVAIKNGILTAHRGIEQKLMKKMKTHLSARRAKKPTRSAGNKGEA